MPANGLRVNRYDFVALHSMWIIFLRGITRTITKHYSCNHILIDILDSRTQRYISTLSHAFIITITTGIYLHVFTLVHYLMHLLGLKFTQIRINRFEFCLSMYYCRTYKPVTVVLRNQVLYNSNCQRQVYEQCVKMR